MCLSDVGRVVHVDVDRHAVRVEVDTRTVDVSTVALGLDAPPLAVGDWLVVHTGLAVGRLDDAEARQILAARAEFALAARPDSGKDST